MLKKVDDEKSQINSMIKYDFQVVLLLSYFVGHPVLVEIRKKLRKVCRKVLLYSKIAYKLESVNLFTHIQTYRAHIISNDKA